MSNDRFASAHEMVREYAELEAKMADPTIHEDQANARKLGRRYAQLGPVVAGFKAWKSSEDDLLAAAELADVDPDFAAEIPALEAARDAAAEKLEELFWRLRLVPVEMSQPCLLAISCVCTCAMQKSTTGKLKSSTPPKAKWVDTKIFL
jgi:protein subunit release factor A